MPGCSSHSQPSPPQRGQFSRGRRSVKRMRFEPEGMSVRGETGTYFTGTRCFSSSVQF
jgi:hypothetical protein